MHNRPAPPFSAQQTKAKLAMRHPTLSNALTRRHFIASITATALLISPGRSSAQTVPTLTPDQAYQAAQTQDIILIDIRRPEEWAQTGVAEGAIGLDMTQKNFVPNLIALRQANPDTPLALICRSGNRSTFISSELTAQGFPGLLNVHEGMSGGRNGPGWLARGLPSYSGTLKEVTKRTENRLR